jgi:RNA polymerase sigma-70 factor (ECF subfamily)
MVNTMSSKLEFIRCSSTEVHSQFIETNRRDNVSVAVAPHTQSTGSDLFLREFLVSRVSQVESRRKSRFLFRTEETGGNVALVCGEGVAMRSITYEVASVIKEGLDSDATWEQEFTPEDLADRTLHVAGNQDVSERGELGIDQRASCVDPREQILALYDEYRPRLFRYLRSMKLYREQAEEIIQEAFMRLTTQLLKKDNIENVQGWIVRVVHNLAVDALKKSGRDAAATSGGTLAIENRADPALSPEESFLKKERIRRMDLALSTFNPRQRECFHMRAQGFRYKDIGLALGISEQRAALVVKQVAVRLAAICG